MQQNNYLTLKMRLLHQLVMKGKHFMQNCLRKSPKNHVSSCIKQYSVVGSWIRQKKIL